MPTKRRRAKRNRKLLAGALASFVRLTRAALGGSWAEAGVYGPPVLFRHGGTGWVPVGTDNPRLSPSMQPALGIAPVATPGDATWRALSVGFDVPDLAAMVGGQAVDRVLLARIDPARFRRGVAPLRRVPPVVATAFALP